MEVKKITIIGPGSLGILFAVKIWQKLSSVTILDHNPKRAKKLNKSGLRLLLPGSDSVMKAFPYVSVDAKELGVQDVVLVLVKAFQTEDILDAFEHLCGADTVVVTLQNGIGVGDILAKVIQEKNLALGVTMHGANKRNFDTVMHAGSGSTFVGMFNKDCTPTKKLEKLADILDQCGFSCSLVNDIYPILWKKLLVNIGINALTCISCLRNGQLLDYPHLLSIQEQAVAEAFEVMKGSGVDIRMEFQDVLTFVRKVCRDTGENISSMLQDRLKKSKTEIDFINGAVVKIGKCYGVKTPVNETLCNLVEFFSKSGWHQGCDGLSSPLVN